MSGRDSWDALEAEGDAALRVLREAASDDAESTARLLALTAAEAAELARRRSLNEIPPPPRTPSRWPMLLSGLPLWAKVLVAVVAAAVGALGVTL